MDSESGSNETQPLQTQDKKEDQNEDANFSVTEEVKNADTEIMTTLGEEGQSSKEDSPSDSKESISTKKHGKGPLEVASSDSDEESSSSKSEQKITKKKGGKVSEEVMKRKETIKALLVSSEIVAEDEDEQEEDLQKENLPEPGKSQFKFLKKRCGKLVDVKTWVPPWDGYNMLESVKSWKPVDEWAPTRQFIRYQNKLVVWRHDHPLAQHKGWDRGCITKYCKRAMVSSSWDT